MHNVIQALIFPCMFIGAWYLTLSGSIPPSSPSDASLSLKAISWLLYFAGYAFLSASIMHSVFAKKIAKSIGWISNGFQYEIAAVSLGLGIGCFYALSQGIEAKMAISLPVISFLFFAGINHLKEIIFNKNFAPNNTFILVWDFGVSISLLVLLIINLGQFQ